MREKEEEGDREEGGKDRHHTQLSLAFAWACSLGATFHLSGMSTNFALFRERFAEACRIRGMKPDAVYRSIGIGARRALDVETVGVLRALDLHRVCQIADRLDVSVDWLVGRSSVMEIPKEGKQVA